MSQRSMFLFLLPRVLHSYNRQSRQPRELTVKTSFTRSFGATRHGRHDAWFKAESKGDYLACIRSAYAESQSPSPFFPLSSGDTFFSRLMLHGGAIHRINKSLSRLLMYARLDLNSRRMISSAFRLLTFSPTRRRARAQFCILVSVSPTFRWNSRFPIGNL